VRNATTSKFQLSYPPPPSLQEPTNPGDDLRRDQMERLQPCLHHGKDWLGLYPRTATGTPPNLPHLLMDVFAGVTGYLAQQMIQVGPFFKPNGKMRTASSPLCMPSENMWLLLPFLCFPSLRMHNQQRVGFTSPSASYAKGYPRSICGLQICGGSPRLPLNSGKT
jgi:hypothetical protein